MEEGEPTKLLFSVPRTDRLLRKAFPLKRVSSSSPVYLTAALESIFSTIIQAADDKRTSLKKPPKSIDRKILIAAVRTHPELGKLFKDYMFLPTSSLKIKKDNLLTRADRELGREEAQRGQGGQGAGEEANGPCRRRRVKRPHETSRYSVTMVAPNV